jgi:hypothetical protein
MAKQRWPFEASAEGLWAQGRLVYKYWVAEYAFHPTRKWRFDMAIVDPYIRVACEYHGGLFMWRKGGHQSVKGSRNDWEKLNEAQLLGWIVLQFGPDETRSGDAMKTIERAVKFRMEHAK